MSKDYVLGTADDELRRLQRQHNLWAPQAREIWQRAGFNSSQKLLDLGCGPGFTTVELAQFLGGQPQITAVDASDRFLGFLQKQANEKVPAAQITTHQSFLEKLDLPEKNFDGAFCRWLMIFVPDVPSALKAVHKHLKPGSSFALQEYVAYETLRLFPDRPEMDLIIAAIFKSWKDQGGDANRARVLPKLLEENGFRVKEIQPVARAARPGEPLWDWPNDFFEIYLPKLVAGGYLAQKTQDDFMSAWKNAPQDPGAFFMGPTVLNIIAEKI